MLSRLAACTILKALKTPAGEELTDQKKKEETAGLFHFSSNSQGRGFVVVWFCLQNGVKCERNSIGFIVYFFSDKMSSLYVQCLKSRVEKAWKEEMANNHTKVDHLHTEKRDHVPVHHHHRKRVCHHADNVQVNGSDTKSMSFVLYSFDDFTLVY